MGTIGLYLELLGTFGFLSGTIWDYFVPLGTFGTSEYFLGQPSLSWQLSLAQLSPNLLNFCSTLIATPLYLPTIE